MSLSQALWEPLQNLKMPGAWGPEGRVTGRWGGEVGRGSHGESESQWGQQAKQFQQVLVED